MPRGHRGAAQPQPHLPNGRVQKTLDKTSSLECGGQNPQGRQPAPGKWGGGAGPEDPGWAGASAAWGSVWGAEAVGLGPDWQGEHGEDGSAESEGSKGGERLGVGLGVGSRGPQVALTSSPHVTGKQATWTALSPREQLRAHPLSYENVPVTRSRQASFSGK